jgi:hypothetical protein
MATLPWVGTAALYASGSQALVRLVRWGAARHRWRRVWLPSYYCPDVPAALMAVAGRQVELLAYPDSMLWEAPNPRSIPTSPGDVVVVANQLGVRPRPDAADWTAPGVVLVEDHSHDLGSAWARDSRADYAFASLRKTLPIPDGGAVWSPQGRELPPEPTDDDADAEHPGARRAPAWRSADRIAAALEARGQVAPATGDRLRFRALARVAAEKGSANGRRGISPVSRALLPQMPLQAWRERRRRNLAVLAEAVSSTPGVRGLAAPPGGVAFALTLVFASAGARHRVQEALVARAVAPVVLWPLDPARDWGVGPADADLSARILSVHGDQRHGVDDMQALARLLREALGG